MARRRGGKVKAKRMKKSEPVQRYLYYNLPVGNAGASGNSFYLDLAAGVSALNRRLYRQGRTYHVANASVVDTSGKLTSARFCTLPDLWTTHKGWSLMFNAWKDQRARTLENSPSYVTGRWADFKVWMSEQHFQEALAAETDKKGGIMPVLSDMDAVPTGEWLISDISTVLNGAEYANRQLWMMGDHNISGSPTGQGFGVLHSLQEMLQQPPESPVLPADFKDSVIMGMNPSTGADLNDDILENIADDNDQPPYDKTTVIGASHTATNSQSVAVREVGWASGAKGIASLPTMGFPVPLGLLECRFTSDGDTTNVGLMLELVPGSYKGVHAEAF